LTNESDDIQRPSGEGEATAPKLIVLSGGDAGADRPVADDDFSGTKESSAAAVPAAWAEPADADLFDGDEDEADEPTPLPDVSLLSVHPSHWAFFWAVLYAVLSGIITIWAAWDPAFRASCHINGYTLHEWDAPVRLLASMMVHSGFDHYLGNMILLVPFAGFATAFYGFWAFPVILVTLGIVTHWLTILSYPLYMGLVGSSGLLFVVFGFWLVLYAWVESHLSFPKRVLRLSGFGLLMLIPHSYSPTTSYRAHYIGLGLGAVAGVLFILVNRKSLRQRTLLARLAEREARQNRGPSRRFPRRRWG